MRFSSAGAVSVVVLLLSFWSGQPVSAGSVLVRYDFTVEVSEVRRAKPALGMLRVGDVVSGFFSFDPATPPEPTCPQRICATTYIPLPPSSIGITIGSETFVVSSSADFFPYWMSIRDSVGQIQVVGRVFPQADLRLALVFIGAHKSSSTSV